MPNKDTCIFITRVFHFPLNPGKSTRTPGIIIIHYNVNVHYSLWKFMVSLLWTLGPFLRVSGMRALVMSVGIQWCRPDGYFCMFSSQYFVHTFPALCFLLSQNQKRHFWTQWLQHHNSFTFKDQLIHNIYLFLECLELSLLADTEIFLLANKQWWLSAYIVGGRKWRLNTCHSFLWVKTQYAFEHRFLNISSLEK